VKKWKAEITKEKNRFVEKGRGKNINKIESNTDGSSVPDPDPLILLKDPDHALFVSDLQDVKKFMFFIFCLLLFEGAFTSFFRDKSHDKVTKQ
jgi:hypothetical protein